MAHLGRANIGGADGRGDDERAAPIVMRPRAVAVADPNRVAAPVAFEGEPGPHGHAGAEGEERARAHVAVIRPRHEHDLGLVVGHVDHVGLSGHDANHVGLGDDLLLRRVDERAGGASLGAEALHRLHHLGRLFDKRLAELFGPVEVFIHPGEHGGIMREGFHALVPRPVLDLRSVAGIVADVPRRQHHIGRGGGGRQNHRDERIRIERDRGEEFLEFLG